MLVTEEEAVVSVLQTPPRRRRVIPADLAQEMSK